MASPEPNNGLNSLNISFILSGNGKSTCAYLHQKKTKFFCKMSVFSSTKIAVYFLFFIYFSSTIIQIQSISIKIEHQLAEFGSIIHNHKDNHN